MIHLTRVTTSVLAGRSKSVFVVQGQRTNGFFHGVVTRRLYSSTTSQRSAVTDKATMIRLLNSMKVVGCLENAVDLSYFTSLINQQDDQAFAVLQLDGSVLQKDLATVVSGLSFLQRVGLYPIVMLESRPQQDRRGQIADNLRLADALERHGARARPLYTNSFVVDRAQDLVPNTAAIEQSIRHHALPIISSLAETPSGQIISNMDTTSATVALAKVLRPRKVIFVNDAGGIMDHNGRKMDRIHMDCPEEMAHLIRAFPSPSLMRRASELFNPATAVTITSAAALHHELFTACGAGTQLCSGGATLARYHGVRDRLVLEQRIPRRSQAHWSTAAAACDAVYLVERGGQTQAMAAIIEGGSGQAAVLEYFGGMTPDESDTDYTLDTLWNTLRKDHPALVWRSTNCKTVGSTAWHFGKADGSLRDQEDGSMVFFYGIKNPAGIMASLKATEKAIQRCADGDPFYTAEATVASTVTRQTAAAVS